MNDTETIQKLQQRVAELSDRLDRTEVLTREQINECDIDPSFLLKEAASRAAMWFRNTDGSFDIPAPSGQVAQILRMLVKANQHTDGLRSNSALNEYEITDVVMGNKKAIVIAQGVAEAMFEYLSSPALNITVTGVANGWRVTDHYNNSEYLVQRALKEQG